VLLCAVAALAGYDRRSLLKHDRGREAVEGGRQRVWTLTMALRGGDAVSEPDNSSTTEKMTSFSMIRKKTPFQKHREEEEAKKKRADEEAARLYEEFVQSFKADDTPGGKAFVRGGTINPSERPKPDSESDPRGRHVDLSYGCTSNLVVCVCDMKIHPFFQGCLAALYLWFIQENLSFYVQLRPVLTVSVYG
jgi:hypothetical protein